MNGKAKHRSDQLQSTGKIGIVTVLFNSGMVLDGFLQSLRQQTYENFAVYAIDNASTDGSADICEAEGNRFVVVRNEDNNGFAQATNQGTRLALEEGCDFVLLLNNDVVFQADFLRQLLQGLQRCEADMVAPLTYYYEPSNVIWAAGGRLQKWAGYRPIHLGMDEKDVGQFSSDLRIEFAPGSCILAMRSVFDTVGFLDETFYTYWEDTDFAVRALKQGLRIYLVPAARLWHKVSSLAGKGSAFQCYYGVRNHALYTYKHNSYLKAHLISALYLSGYAVLSMLRFDGGARIKAWRDGMKLARAR